MSGGPHKKPTISLRLDPELLADIEAAAAAQGISRHAWLVNLIDQHARAIAWQEAELDKLDELDEAGRREAAAAPSFLWFDKGDRAGG